MPTTCYPVTKPARESSPTFEPVTTSEAKKQCELPESLTDHDSYLNTVLIPAARELVERDSGVVACTGTYTFKRTTWPCREWFELPDIRPITAVSSITYVGTNGTTETFSASSYALDTFGVRPFVRLAYGAAWPALRGDINGITITATAGYASKEAVPAKLKLAVLLLISHWFDHRSAIGTVGGEIALAYDALVTSLRQEVYA